MGDASVSCLLKHLLYSKSFCPLKLLLGKMGERRGQQKILVDPQVGGEAAACHTHNSSPVVSGASPSKPLHTWCLTIILKACGTRFVCLLYSLDGIILGNGSKRSSEDEKGAQWAKYWPHKPKILPVDPQDCDLKKSH